MGISCKPTGAMKSFMKKNVRDFNSNKKLANLAKEDNQPKKKS